MFNQNTSADTKIAVLEERLSSFEIMLKKIDEAIQIMGKTSQNISKMLAVHEERIEQGSKSDGIIANVIHELKEDNQKKYDELDKKISDLQNDVEDISKIKWMTVGCGVVLLALTAALASLASGWWTPSEMQMQRQGHVHQYTDTQNNK